MIRADASTEIGIGHVMRSLALAEAWQEREGMVCFAAAELSAPVEERIRRAGCEITRIEAPCGSLEDAAQLRAIRDRMQPNWIALDGYCFDGGYQRQLAGSACRTLVVDDHATIGEYAADMVLDQNLGAKGSVYEDAGCTGRLLMGSRYALLRRDFRNMARTVKEIIPDASRILVTLGGGDPDNVTAKVVRSLALLPGRKLSIRVVLGAANPHRQMIEQIAAAAPHDVELIAATDQMHELMAWADVAITGGGSTCWELALLELPCVILVLAENQRPIAEHLAARGFAINLGWHEDAVEAELAAQVASLLTDPDRRRLMAANGRTVVDGRGALRVVEAMLE